VRPGPVQNAIRAPASALGPAYAACALGLAYAAISVYWGLGGTWLLDTVGGTFQAQGRVGRTIVVLAVWAAAALKVLAAVLPLLGIRVAPAAAPGTPPWQRLIRTLAWAEAVILTMYGLALTGTGLLVQSGVIAAGPGADHRVLAWHAYLWDPWFLVWGVLVTIALRRARAAGTQSRGHRISHHAH
jgi:Protein of unknown function (DUF3995)